MLRKKLILFQAVDLIALLRDVNASDAFSLGLISSSTNTITNNSKGHTRKEISLRLVETLHCIKISSTVKYWEANRMPSYLRFNLLCDLENHRCLFESKVHRITPLSYNEKGESGMVAK